MTQIYDERKNHFQVTFFLPPLKSLKRETELTSSIKHHYLHLSQISRGKKEEKTEQFFIMYSNTQNILHAIEIKMQLA